MINLSALPFLTKVIVILSVLLFISFGLNTYQLYHSGVVSGRAEKQKEVEMLTAKNAGLEKTAAVNIAIADMAVTDNQTLVEDLKTIAESAQVTKTVYKEVASKAPLPASCAPGGLRVQTVNKELGGKK